MDRNSMEPNPTQFSPARAPGGTGGEVARPPRSQPSQPS
eukprot:TCALIF_06652-PA protein Name:"Protein of unknown function" AED:0.03 eAED:0.03 QI:492/1/1/1/1/1/7/2992/38